MSGLLHYLLDRSTTVRRFTRFQLIDLKSAGIRMMPPIIYSCVAVAVLVGPAAAMMGQDGPLDYPQWRGHNRDGAASAFSEPESWPEHLRLRWRVDVGEGYATPILVGNTVYAFTRRDGKEGIIALDADTGETVWRTDYPVPYEAYEDAVDHGGGPKATPLFHNGKLYTLGISGTISAFEAFSGKLVWQKPAPSRQPYLGTASSPIGDRDLVIVQADGYNALTAFEANTGSVKWTVKNEFTFASPIIVDLHGTRQVIALAQQSILGISVADGAVLWEHPWKSPFVQAITPVLYRETIIVSGHHRGVMALKPIRREDKWVVDVAWETQEVSMFLSNPVVVGDTLFGLSHRNSGQYFAIDASTGQVLWLGRPRQATNTALVKAANLLFFLNDDAELIVGRSSRTGFEPITQYRV
ncbi:MAG: PQQ-binding-like beta-propeller repeat protein, partial [Acidimicrobiia bacterium]